eukprot:2578552-Rhodomonas_salina.2
MVPCSYTRTPWPNRICVGPVPESCGYQHTLKSTSLFQHTLVYHGLGRAQIHNAGSLLRVCIVPPQTKRAVTALSRYASAKSGAVMPHLAPAPPRPAARRARITSSEQEMLGWSCGEMGSWRCFWFCAVARAGVR